MASLVMTIDSSSEEESKPKKHTKKQLKPQVSEQVAQADLIIEKEEGLKHLFGGEVEEEERDTGEFFIREDGTKGASWSYSK
jgi:hypothetical protein